MAAFLSAFVMGVSFFEIQGVSIALDELTARGE